MVESVSSRKTKKVVIGRQRHRAANHMMSPIFEKITISSDNLITCGQKRESYKLKCLW